MVSGVFDVDHHQNISSILNLAGKIMSHINQFVPMFESLGKLMLMFQLLQKGAAPGLSEAHSRQIHVICFYTQYQYVFNCFILNNQTTP